MLSFSANTDSTHPIAKWLCDNDVDQALSQQIANVLDTMNLDLKTLQLCRYDEHHILPTIQQILHCIAQQINEKYKYQFHNIQQQFVSAFNNIQMNHDDTIKPMLTINTEQQELMNELNDEYDIYSTKLSNMHETMMSVIQTEDELHVIITEMFDKLENKLNEKQRLFHNYITNIGDTYQKTQINKYQNKLTEIITAKLKYYNICSQYQTDPAEQLISYILQINTEELKNDDNNDAFKEFKQIQQRVETDMLQSMDMILNINYKNNNISNYNYYQMLKQENETLSHSLKQLKNDWDCYTKSLQPLNNTSIPLHANSLNLVERKDINENKLDEPLWGKRTRCLTTKGSKRRMLIEWHFVTSDDNAHKIVLRNTEDRRKTRTRQILWVDGAEKYNSKAARHAFRVEINRDVVIIKIVDKHTHCINNYVYDVDSQQTNDECLDEVKMKHMILVNGYFRDCEQLLYPNSIPYGISDICFAYYFISDACCTLFIYRLTINNKPYCECYELWKLRRNRAVNLT